MTNVKPSLFIPNETGYGAQFVTGTLGGTVQYSIVFKGSWFDLGLT